MKITHKTPAHLYIAGFALAFLSGFFMTSMSSELHNNLVGLATLTFFVSSVWMCVLLLKK